MAAPSIRAAGTVATGSGNVTPGIPAGSTTNDIMLLYVHSSNQTITGPGSGWVEVPDSPQGTGTAAAAGSVRLAVFWKRHTGSESNPTITDTGDHTFAVIISVQGCVTSGDPWDVTAGGVDSSATSLPAPADDTTTVSDTFVLFAWAHARDSNTANLSGSTGSTNLDGGITATHTDSSVNTGTGGGFIIQSGVKNSPGSLAGSYQILLAASSKTGKHTIALKPPVTGSVGTAAGVATAAATGAATATTSSTVNGVATAAATGIGENRASGTADGVATAAATGQSTAAAAGSAAGVGAAAATGQSTATAAGSAAGVGAAAATGQSTATAAGTSDGVSTAAATGFGAANGVGAAAGVATAAAAGSATGAGAGSAAGAATAAGVAAAFASAAGTAGGVGTASATGLATAQAAGTAAGTGTASAAGIAEAQAVGTAQAGAAQVPSLMEGFNSLSGSGPYTGDLVWTGNGGARTITLAGSPVTEGADSWRLQASAGATGITRTGRNLTAFNRLKLDIDIDAIDPLGYIYLQVFDIHTFEGLGVSSVTGATGTVSLDLDLSFFSNPYDVWVTIGFATEDSNPAGAVDVNLDNLQGIGGGDVRGVGEALAAAAGAAAGVATATAAGASTAEAAGTAAGTSTASAEGLTGSLTTGTAAGTATAAAVGAGIVMAVGTCSAGATAAAVGASSAEAAGAASGAGSANGIGLSFAQAAGAAAGAGTAEGAGQALALAAGAAAGIADVSATGHAVAYADGQAAGASTAMAISGSGSTGVSNGNSTCEAVGYSISVGVGSAAGAATASAEGEENLSEVLVGLFARDISVSGRRAGTTALVGKRLKETEF